MGNSMHFSTSARDLIGARGIIGALLLLGLPSVAMAQSARDSAAYANAREMVANGDAMAGRHMADSVAALAPVGSVAFAEGLFWRATLAANARDSERFYRQIIVDYPLSGRVSDALLRIGQLESARGDNAAALQHFQRLVLEHPDSPLRPEASYWVAQMYFKANDAPKACAANADALASVRSSNVELKNRVDFQQQRCRGVTLATSAPASPAASARPVLAPKETVNNTESRARERARAESARVEAQNAEKAKAKAAAEAAAEAEAKASKAARLKADSIATVRAEARITAESLAIARRAEVKAKANAASVNKATVESSITSSTASKSSGILSAPPGAVTREPTREEVARALASADMPASSRGKAHVVTSPKASEATGTGSGMFAVQIAAFGNRGAANLLVAKMRGRGYDAYVDGGAAPYRVRVGHYKSHAAAAAALVKMKVKKIDGFVAER